MAANYNRKRIFVDRHVQGGIVARLIVLWLGFALLASMVWLTLEFLSDPTAGLSHYLQDIGSYVTPLLLAFGVTMPIVILHLLRFTHRFAGPVVRLRRLMRELADGQQVPNLKFRDGDYWPDLADEFNRIATMVAEQKKQIAELQQLCGQGEAPLDSAAELEHQEPVTVG